MKKFKTFFYPLYILVILVVLYFTIDIILHKEAYMTKLDFSIIKKLPGYTIVLLLFLSTLMTIELVAENLHVLNLRRKLNAKEKEVLDLKAKLYDKSQQKPQPPAENQQPKA